MQLASQFAADTTAHRNRVRAVVAWLRARYGMYHAPRYHPRGYWLVQYAGTDGNADRLRQDYAERFVRAKEEGRIPPEIIEFADDVVDDAERLDDASRSWVALSFNQADCDDQEADRCHCVACRLRNAA